MLTDAGQRVFDARYAARDDEGNIIEDFEQAVGRVACAAAMAEKPELQGEWCERFQQEILARRLVPSTPIWANMGKTDRPNQPGACFCLSVDDTLDSMYQTLKDTAMVFKMGGGVGYNFSTIRPRGDLIMSTKGKASGVVELIKLYDKSSDMVLQGGIRRGASMGILNVDHPEIIDFITSKKSGGIVNFNISVGVTDEFMDAVEQDGPWTLRFGGKDYRTLPAREIWDLIAESAHACGDPGIIFLDALERGNPMLDRELNCTNPCGELPLSTGESCLLASIDLSKFVTPDGVDFDALRETVKVGVRFLDNMIDVGEYPLPIIDQMTKETRKIGLGITGLADTLITLGLPYDSERGRAAAEGIMSVIRETADKYAAELAEEKGNFPAWESSVYHFHYDTPKPRRNATCITIAPTGSVTTIASCEGYGIEPIFAVAYQKATNVAGDFNVFSPLFLEKTKHLNLSQEILDKIAKTGSCQNVPEIPAEVQRLFRGAQEIAPEDHLLMQAALQKYVDNAVSKTINAPNSATVDDIKQMYLLAHQKGLKGITVFRDGCKDGVIKIGESGASGAPTGGLARGVIEPRPVTADGETTCLRTGCGKLYLTTNFVDNRPIETFISTGSKGGCQAYTEATSRLISLALRGGISVEDVCEQLNSTHPCASYQLARGQGRELAPGKSCASAIARKLLKYVQGERKEPEKSGEKCCPMCGEPYKRAEGCFVCVSCGYSEC